MSKQITLTLPDDVLDRAAVWAGHLGRPVDELLAQAIELSLSPPVDAAGDARPVQEWADDEVLAATAAEMADEADRRLSELLRLQQAGELAATEAAELHRLMQQYRARLLLKAVALREAVRRGLREPLQP